MSHSKRKKRDADESQVEEEVKNRPVRPRVSEEDGSKSAVPVPDPSEGKEDEDDDREESDPEAITCSECQGKSLDIHRCESCQDAICDHCWKEEYHLYEWLVVPSECERCHRFTCWGCIWTCYDCANKNQGCTSGVWCSKCETGLSVVPCKCNHGWITCGKHEQEREANEDACGECDANRNFDGRYGRSY